MSQTANNTRESHSSAEIACSVVRVCHTCNFCELLEKKRDRGLLTNFKWFLILCFIQILSCGTKVPLENWIQFHSLILCTKIEVVDIRLDAW